MDKTEKQICGYTSVLIAIMINSGKLMALRENGIVAHYWHFNLAELLFQVTYTLGFCHLIFYLNLDQRSSVALYRNQRRDSFYYLVNAAIVLLCTVPGCTFQYIFFAHNKFPIVFITACIARFGLSTILIGIVIRIILLMREGRKKEAENQQLKSASMAAELELLKAQMNPHFLFNSLSSLSGVIRENSVLAQKYVRELSNVFRYALVHSKTNLVAVEEELIMLRSFVQLLNMRLEGAFRLDIMVPESSLSYHLPHLSLQPLLENAIKHNAATCANPLIVEIYVLSDHLIVSNNIREIPVPESSNGIGLANLNERFKIMMNREIEIIRHKELFIVKLPLSA